MAGWRFDVTDSGKKDIKKLDAVVRLRILEKLKWFTEHFQNITPFPLYGIWKGFFKLRVGEWRVIYDVDYEAQCVTVHAIENRGKVYKKHARP